MPYFILLRTDRVQSEILIAVVNLIDEGGGDRRAQPQVGIIGRARCCAALLERWLTKSREEMQAGAIPAAICIFICIICARADRSDYVKVAAMLPRDGGNCQAMA